LLTLRVRVSTTFLHIDIGKRGENRGEKRGEERGEVRKEVREEE
jgi:hypothetical protein